MHFSIIFNFPTIFTTKTIYIIFLLFSFLSSRLEVIDDCDNVTCQILLKVVFFFGISRPFFTKVNSEAYLCKIDENNVYN